MIPIFIIISSAILPKTIPMESPVSCTPYMELPQARGHLMDTTIPWSLLKGALIFRNPHGIRSCFVVGLPETLNPKP